LLPKTPKPHAAINNYLISNSLGGVLVLPDSAGVVLGAGDDGVALVVVGAGEDLVGVALEDLYLGSIVRVPNSASVV